MPSAVRTLFVTLSFSLLLCAKAAYAAAAAPLGLLLDVSGTATSTDAAHPAAPRKLEALAYVENGMDIQLAAGAQIVLTWYAARTEQTYRGPAHLQVVATGIRVVDGVVASSRRLDRSVVSYTQRGAADRLTQAAMVMRGNDATSALIAVSPAEDNVILEQRPALQWSGTAAGPYTIEILGPGGVSVATATGNSAKTLAWPGAAALKRGASYEWRVTAADGKRASALFSVADAGVEKLVSRERPADSASAAQWRVYALRLQSLGLRAEAELALRRAAELSGR